MIEFTKPDLNKLITVMAALKRGKYELEGEEVLAFAQSFAWLSQLSDKVKADLEKPLEAPSEPKKAKK